jgi:hypothetical protein
VDIGVLPFLERVKITVDTAKNDPWGEGNAFFFGHPSNATCPDIVNEMFMWAVTARYTKGADDVFFSHKNGTHRTCLTYEAMLHSTHLIARGFGHNPQLFGTHSFRIGGASALLASGQRTEMIMRIGRWRSLTFLNYLRVSVREFDQLADALMDPLSLTSADVSLMDREREGYQNDPRPTSKRFKKR